MSKLQVIQNFDNIASYSSEGWDHNNHYHNYLLRHLPDRRDSVLDIGSGLGQFSRILAEHFRYVEGIDFSPKMVEEATARSSSINNIRYRCVDFLETEFPEKSFDCITSIATLHHLPFRRTIEKIRTLLRPGGRLLILDLYKNRQLPDYVYSAIGAVANLLVMAFRRENRNDELKKAWAEHILLDDYMTIGEIKREIQNLLPNAAVKRHIFFRYSLIWEKRPDHVPFSRSCASSVSESS